MKRHIAALILIVATTAYATPKSPVQWSIKSGPARAKGGATIALNLAGQIDPGWHLYALEEPDGGPVATVVGLTEGDPADLLSVTESKPILLNDPLFNLQTGFFRSNVNFTLRLKVDRSAHLGPNPLHLLIRFQSCNDRVCLPPHTDTVAVPFIVIR